MIGRIEYLFLPKSNIFFNDVEHVFFKMITENGESIVCSGYSFYLKSKFKIDVEGHFVKDVYQFNNIELDLNDEETKKELVKLVLGNEQFVVMNKKISTDEIFKNIANRPYEYLKTNKIYRKSREKYLSIFLKIVRMEKLKDKINDGLSINDKNKLFKLNISEINQCLDNPYLLESKLNFSFKTCSKLFKCKTKLVYILDGAIYEIFKNNYISGNTILKFNDFVKSIENMTGFKKETILKYVNSLIRNKKIVISDDYVMTQKINKDIVFLNAKIKNLIKKDTKTFIDDSLVKEVEKEKNVALGKEQIDAVKNSVDNQISVITGGPGTGKTTILSCVLSILLKYYDEDEIALCSPTGKAAIRMSESTGFEASTIHSLLGVIPNEEKDDDFTFIHNESNKLPFNLVVIDEASMIDQKLAVNLFKALKENVHIIFVGDINQLPPVGAGYFFRDLINFNVPCVKLIKTYRQSGDSTIIKLAKEIQKGKITSLKNADDFGFKKLINPEEIVDIYLRGVKSKGIENIEILTPQNKGDLGTIKLNNMILKRILPKEGREINLNGYTFKEGARVIQTKNDYSLGVINGQIGTIKKIDLIEKIVTIEYSDKEYKYSPEALKNVALGYAITIHKSQGSERKYVIQVCSKEHKMNTKPLVYTGITRAKEKLIIIGDKETFISSPSKEAKQVLSYF